jgi:hypothetical protein
LTEPSLIPISVLDYKCTENEIDPNGHGSPMLALACISNGKASAWT